MNVTTLPPVNPQCAAPLPQNKVDDLIRLLNTSQAATRLGVSKRTLQELVSDRKVGFVKFGRNLRFDQADLDKFIESHRRLPVGWKQSPAKNGGAS